MLVGLVIMAVLMTMSGVVWGYTTVQIKSSKQAVSNTQLLHMAEAGLDKAVYELNQNTSFVGESNVAIGEGTYTTTVTNIDATNKQVTSTAYIPNSTNPTSQITVKVRVGIDSTVISFNYGVQAGSGGFVMTGGATINGNVYSNGTINATTGVRITGSASAANPPATFADQSNNSPTPISSCSSSTCITYGNATATEDFAQSFRVSDSERMNYISLYIRKNGSPSNSTLRIVTDNSGSPSSTTLMSATLSAASVTTNFGWVNVTMPPTPILEPSQTYWIVLDGSSNASNYYIIGANTSYANGTAKIGRQSAGTWANTSPSGLDGYFQIYLGGGTSMIGGNTYNTGVYVGTTGTDLAWANNVMGATVSGPLYCQTSSYTNKACNTSRPDPTPQPMPLSDGNIENWKEDAESGGVHNGDYNVGWQGATIGPKKINGNLTVGGGGTLTVTGTLWVTGNITTGGGGTVRLDSSYGSNSGAIVSDGWINVAGGSNFAGSGTAGSYPFLITTSACPVAPGCGSNDAIYLSGGAGAVAIVAQNGNVRINGGSSLKAVTGKQITMDGGASLTYDSGLISESFNSGPGGSWAKVAGTYIIVE